MSEAFLLFYTKVHRASDTAAASQATDQQHAQESEAEGEASPGDQQAEPIAEHEAMEVAN